MESINYIITKKKENSSNIYTYTPFEPYPPSTESSTIIEIKESEYTKTSYFTHFKQTMYLSNKFFKASLCFFINALFPTILQEQSHAILRDLKKND